MSCLMSPASRRQSSGLRVLFAHLSPERLCTHLVSLTAGLGQWGLNPPIALGSNAAPSTLVLWHGTLQVVSNTYTLLVFYRQQRYPPLTKTPDLV